MELELDEETSARLQRRAEKLGFDSREAYAALVLHTVLDELAEPRDDESVEERLEDLGYR